MSGVIASQQLLTQQGDDSFTGATLDFINEVYTVNGVAVTAADVISDPGRVGVSGLSITTTHINILGDTRDFIMEGEWTIIVEFLPAVPAGPGHDLFFITCQADFVLDQIALFTTNLRAEFYDESNAPFSNRAFDDSGNFGTANVINKIAWSRNDGRAALSINGNAVVFDETNVTGMVIDEVQAADTDVATSSFIRAITVLPIQDEADLPTLSA